MTALIGALIVGLALQQALALESIHSSLLGKIKSSLSLKLTDFATKYDADSFSANGYSGTCEWWDETKGARLTGVSANTLLGPDGFSSYQINAWMGPAYNCPHLLLTLGTDSRHKGMSIRADYVARGPTPLGSDQTILDLYYNRDVAAWYDEASARGCEVLAPRSTLSARLLRSPFELAIAGLDKRDGEAIASEHVDRWISFVQEASQNEPRQRGAMNTRDDKQRQYAYLAEVAECVAIVGADFGPKLGAARTGPVAEAYVGGGG